MDVHVSAFEGRGMVRAGNATFRAWAVSFLSINLVKVLNGQRTLHECKALLAALR